MKKIFMVAATTVALSSTALADVENMFYIKGVVGGQYLQSAKDKYSGLNLKSTFVPYVALGPGYYIMDNLRTDLTLEYYFNPTLKKTANGAHSHHKGNVWGLMLNGYVDLFDVSITKMFAGAGVGWAQVKEKIRWKSAAGNTGRTSVGNSNNFAYALTLGVNTEVAQGVTGELSYSWKDFGKTNSRAATNATAPAGAKVGGTHYRGHHVNLGLRFDI